MPGPPFSLQANHTTVKCGATVYFVDASILHLREFVDVETAVERLLYVYQYMEAHEQLQFRYDNTGHPKQLNLLTYPHHKHEGSDKQVVPSPALIWQPF